MAEIRRNPQRKLSVTVEWYEGTVRTDPAKAAKGLMLLTVLNGRDSLSDAVDVQGVAVTRIDDLHASAEKRIVISLHGIRTRGNWQKQLASALSRADFIYEPLDYGFFRAIQLVLPFTRDSKTRWFLDEYWRVTAGSKDPPCVIAHSFGTYLVARTLLKYEEVKFDRIIFCGSIVDVAYPWSSIFKGHRVTRVLNDYGGKDFWAKSSEWFVNDAGPSGAKGFEDNAEGQVIKRYRPEFRHSDFFYRANYESTWIPFLQGRDPGLTESSARRPANWKFRTVVSLLALFVVLLSVYGVRWVRTRVSSGKVTVQRPQYNLALPTKAEEQLSQLKRDYSVAQDRLRKLDDIIANRGTNYSFMDQGRLTYYKKARDENKIFLDAASAAASKLAQGEALDDAPRIPDLSLGWPDATASASYTLWHENQRNNNFTVLYVTVFNGLAHGITLHLPDGTVQQFDVNASAITELSPSPLVEYQVVDGIQILKIERMAWSFPGHRSLTGSRVEVTSPLGTGFASATVGQPTTMSR